MTGTIPVKCAIAVDSGNECIGEIIIELLPVEWRPHVTLSACDQWTDVIELARNASPALLVVHSNLFLLSPKDGIEKCVSISPKTRYLLVTAWSEESIEPLVKYFEALPVSVLRMPFNRTQLVAAVEGAFG